VRRIVFWLMAACFLATGVAWAAENADPAAQVQSRLAKMDTAVATLHDYRGAAEVFWPLVHHPLATTLPNYQQAVFFLADSLFNIGAYNDARDEYEVVVKDRQSEYFGISLMRLIEIAVIQKRYDDADRLYAQFLAEFPQEEDGSLGRYIIGKSFYLRGETAKAIEIFDSIPESGAYYPTAQYFAAVIFVKQRNFQEAINRLQRVKRALNPDSANRARVHALTHLALGRIYYEMNDFPQAMARYYTVPADTPEYSEALYESMWVFITRNDFLIRALDEERSGYEDILFSFSDFRENLADQPDRQSVADLSHQTEALQGELDGIRKLFDEIDKKLSRLQEEALASFNKLLAAAPNHRIIPEAELLVGNIYTQVEDFQAAEQWFNKVRDKYESFYQSVHASQASMSPADRLDVLSVGAEWMASGGQLDPARTRGLPPEIVYWLIQEPRVQRMLVVYRGILKERENLAQMRRMLDEATAKLAEMEAGTGGYPFLREARRKMLEMRSDVTKLQVEATALRSDAEHLADANLRGQVEGRIGGHEQLLQTLQGRLTELEAKIEAKKRERIAYFRQELDALREPIESVAGSVEELYSRAADATARAAAREMDDIELRLRDYVDRADLGIIDVEWRATRGSSREIRDIQREMQEEIRRFQRMQRGAPAPGAPAPTPAGTPAPAPSGTPTPTPTPAPSGGTSPTPAPPSGGSSPPSPSGGSPPPPAPQEP
jgi:tetratricopeptide (TPR) repeat protein